MDKVFLRRRVVGALAGGAILMFAPRVDAHITRIQVITRESPTFGGYSWPGIGQYEKIAGKAFGEVDPADPKNSLIVDIQLAPRNARGNVEYAFDFYILKPLDLTRGAHKVMYEPPNRGRKTWAALGRISSGGNDPGSITDAKELADSFLMPRGYTMVWSGWDVSAGTNPAGFVSTITVPVAKHSDGSAVTGPAYEYIVNAGASYALSYPASTLDQRKATLTHRVRLNDSPQVIPATGWTYNAGGTAISLLPSGTRFIANDIYEFSYIAKDPTVNGLGFAAIRDWNAFLRYETKDAAGTANPMAGDIQRIYTETSSQPGRMLNDFVNLGFNQAENGKKVFDGMMQWIAAGDGINLNYRFSQPNRTERNRQDHLYVEAVFPFANVTTTDPLTGKTASRYDKCMATSTCPLAVEIYSANEYWVKAASLLHTDPTGTTDLPDSPFARNYLIASHQHGAGGAITKGVCQQFRNPLDSSPVQRALFVALDEWSTKGTPPPPSEVPRLSDGTLVPPLPQSGLGFPPIPGVVYNGLKTTRYLANYGPNFYATGIATINPPVFTAPYQDNPANGPIYPSFVPRTDADGNDVGIRLPDVTVPLATYTGWALRAGSAAGDGCEGAGQYIPFARTKAERVANGDPRLSIEERYSGLPAYSDAVKRAIEEMVARRLMLREDTRATLDRLLRAAQATGALRK
jgi:Alpha/beta hydrolase domain